MRTTVVVPFFNEEGRIRSTLASIYGQTHRPNGFEVILVDNGSTDGSRQCADRFAHSYPDFPLIIIEEPEKGTGRAADTGFRHAIRRGADAIARTDADTIVAPTWLEAGLGVLRRPGKLHVHGPIRPRRDDGSYRCLDVVKYPLYSNIGRALYGIMRLEPGALRFFGGANTFVRSTAYEAVGGYPRTEIADLGEDVVLAIAIRKTFGFSALGWARHAVAYTSMRRYRRMSAWGLLDAYVFRPTNREVRLRASKGDMDIR